MLADLIEDRQVVRITGADREGFLQGLVTNDVTGLARLTYAALLTPQGKYLADFFLLPSEGAILLDVQADLAPGLMQRLAMYKLRSDVQLEAVDMPVYRGTGDAPEGAWPDPRDPSLGWRVYGPLAAAPSDTDWDALRVAALVPESGVELIPNDSYILEAGFERLSGVDFKKGCYVGQEVTARMKHKTELRKGLARVAVEGAAPSGTEILAGDRAAGTLYTQAQGQGIAYLRFDRAGADMTAGDATVSYRTSGATST